MDWKEMLSKLKLIDITPKVEGKQVGAINVNISNKTENITYNFIFPSANATESVPAGFRVTPEFEERVREETERRLKDFGVSPDILSANSTTEVASAAFASNAVSMMETVMLKKPKK